MGKPYDIAVIGGGIVGLATALALKDHGRIVVLEAEDRLAAHQTGNNSGVIHSGLYYRPGSLKARNCVSGRESLYRFCREHGIAHQRCGKIVVCTREDELPALAELEKRGTANGLAGIRRLPPQAIGEYEPQAAGLAALFVPDTGIVDYTEVTGKYAELLKRSGGDIRLGFRVERVHPGRDEIVIGSTGGEIKTVNLINCAGLYADRIARLCGVDPGLKIIPFRGEYYTLIPERHSLVKNLIYPVPDPRFPFLGVHFTRMIHGEVEAGPNAVLAFKREGYKKFSFSARDVGEYMLYGGFWKMGMRNWKMGVGEYRRSFSKRAFVKALQRLIPKIVAADLRPGGAGVRAQAVLPDGRLLDDFAIRQSERMIHVLNAPSPAATASLSIGETIAAMAREHFRLPTHRGP